MLTTYNKILLILLLHITLLLCLSRVSWGVRSASIPEVENEPRLACRPARGITRVRPGFGLGAVPGEADQGDRSVFPRCAARHRRPHHRAEAFRRTRAADDRGEPPRRGRHPWRASDGKVAARWLYLAAGLHRHARVFTEPLFQPRLRFAQVLR